jgi:hypothetical protein
MNIKRHVSKKHSRKKSKKISKRQSKYKKQSRKKISRKKTKNVTKHHGGNGNANRIYRDIERIEDNLGNIRKQINKKYASSGIYATAPIPSQYGELKLGPDPYNLSPRKQSSNYISIPPEGLMTRYANEQYRSLPIFRNKNNTYNVVPQNMNTENNQFKKPY